MQNVRESSHLNCFRPLLSIKCSSLPPSLMAWNPPFTADQIRSAAAPTTANDEESDEEDEARLKRLRNLSWPPKSVPSGVGNDEKSAGYFLYPLVTVDLSTKQSTAAPAGTKWWSRLKETWEICHDHHHSRTTTTTAQHSGGPSSSTSWNLGSKVWR